MDQLQMYPNVGMIVLVAPAPAGPGESEKLLELSRSLAPLPDGVWQAAANVWLVHPTPALDFVLKAVQNAAEGRIPFRAYTGVPKPPAAA